MAGEKRSRENEALIGSWVEAITRFDIRALADLVTKDATWRCPASSPLGGTYRGRGAIARHVIDTAQLSGGSLRRQVVGIVAGETYGFAACRISAAPNGAEDAAGEIMLFRLKGGRVSQIISFLSDDTVMRSLSRAASVRLDLQPA